MFVLVLKQAKSCNPHLSKQTTPTPNNEGKIKNKFDLRVRKQWSNHNKDLDWYINIDNVLILSLEHVSYLMLSNEMKLKYFSIHNC